MCGGSAVNPCRLLGRLGRIRLVEARGRETLGGEKLDLGERRVLERLIDHTLIAGRVTRKHELAGDALYRATYQARRASARMLLRDCQLVSSPCRPETLVEVG